ncbi:MAG: methionyl-tRNA formyltransferase [Sedimentisphaerales bacterium]|jgi:methionyl-tRNA formyltransferase|nr:methionyl-tRNA formyltransferase [Sedimentisphaerales bacterium]
MDIVFFGSGHFGIPCLQALLGTHHKIGLVVTACPHPAGRGRMPTPTVVAKWARGHQIDVLETDNVDDPAVIGRVEAIRPDLLLVIAFGQKLGRSLIKIPTKGAINVHASLLPRWRGAAPINWAIIAGDQQTGVSIITLADKIDAGHIIAQEATQIGPDEDAGQLHDRLAQLAAPLLVETLAKIEKGTAEYRPQDPAAVTLAPKLKKFDGFIDFAQPADRLARMVRGLWPWPGATADYLPKHGGRSVRLIIAAARPAEGMPGLAPGVLDQRLYITCGQGALNVMAVKPSGSDLMDWRDFVNGRHVRPGDAFVSIGQT